MADDAQEPFPCPRPGCSGSAVATREAMLRTGPVRLWECSKGHLGPLVIGGDRRA